MEQSVAVLLTGKLSNLFGTTTLSNLKRNVLLHNAVHLFVVVENDTPLSNFEAELWLRKEVRVQWMHCFSIENYPEAFRLQQTLCEDKMKWANALQHQSKMLACFQLHLANLGAASMEREHRFMFDFVVRVRTDAVFAQPVNFRWLQWSDDAVRLRLRTLGGDPETLLPRFMATLLHDDIFEPNININAFLPCYDDHRMPESLTGSSVNRYLRNGHYILTFFHSKLFIVRRKYSYELGLLGSASLGRPLSSSDKSYWTDVQSQFRRECNHSGLSVFDYSHPSPHCALVVGN